MTITKGSKMEKKDKKSKVSKQDGGISIKIGNSQNELVKKQKEIVKKKFKPKTNPINPKLDRKINCEAYLGAMGFEWHHRNGMRVWAKEILGKKWKNGQVLLSKNRWDDIFKKY